ncbi:thioredoxin domain-containing protein [Paenibacillus sp. B01]|nr:thioredoxin domain-containing protein [Paenibacillus sp. B01]
MLFVSNQALKNGGETNSFKNGPDTSTQPIVGDPESKVTIVEFGDYKCPSCKAWGEQIYPKLKEAYIDNGKAKFAYVNVLFHGEESRLGALASEAVWSQNPEAFWPFHKALFDAQPTEDHDAAWITTEKILEIAGTIEPAINVSELGQTLSNLSTLPEVNQDEQMVQDFKVKQTPTIMINNVMVTDPFNYDTIVKLIEEEL